MPLELTINGKTVAVKPGTTVAAAILNSDEYGFRSSVDGSPRGPICGMGVCFECRCTIDGTPHVRACLVPCQPGMVVTTDA